MMPCANTPSLICPRSCSDRIVTGRDKNYKFISVLPILWVPGANESDVAIYTDFPILFIDCCCYVYYDFWRVIVRHSPCTWLVGGRHAGACFIDCRGYCLLGCGSFVYMPRLRCSVCTLRLDWSFFRTVESVWSSAGVLQWLFYLGSRRCWTQQQWEIYLRHHSISTIRSRSSTSTSRRLLASIFLSCHFFNLVNVYHLHWDVFRRWSSTLRLHWFLVPSRVKFLVLLPPCFTLLILWVNKGGGGHWRHSTFGLNWTSLGSSLQFLLPGMMDEQSGLATGQPGYLHLGPGQRTTSQPGNFLMQTGQTFLAKCVGISSCRWRCSTCWLGSWWQEPAGRQLDGSRRRAAESGRRIVVPGTSPLVLGAGQLILITRQWTAVARQQEPGIRLMVLGAGSWYRTPGSLQQEPGSRCQAPAVVLGGWYRSPGRCQQEPDSWLQAPGRW